MWESCQMMPLVSGFSRGSPVSPALSFRRCSMLTSITLIGSQDLAVKSPHISSLTRDWNIGLAAPHRSGPWSKGSGSRPFAVRPRTQVCMCVCACVSGRSLQRGFLPPAIDSSMAAKEQDRPRAPYRTAEAFRSLA
ncbi:hypothetical protein PR048_003638 [Dryococelus australis]|uniref:Uncharacterized protein n=1 Tax=Dryococelus australis TaxID=614101 RepID=A0ABQ9INL7_9NEOP|nr:hypothetical protein PR048_003638 [Dryococelus australis]